MSGRPSSFGVKNLIVYHIVFAFNAMLAASTDSEVQKAEVCMLEHFRPVCPAGAVIRIDSALYGRMRSPRCASGSDECFARVEDYVEKNCAGRQTCDISVPSVELHRSAQGCDANLVNHLVVEYRCMQVYNTTEDCHGSNPRLRISAERGYLASVVTAQTARGSLGCPWLIETHPRRTIVLTLIDYGPGAGSGLSTLHSQDSKCFIYAKVTDGSLPVTSHCGGEERSRVILRSTTNSVQVALFPVTDKHFLVKFEAIGCPGLAESPGGNHEKSGDDIRVHCEDTGESWIASCVNGSWTPNRTCSAALAVKQAATEIGLNQGAVILLVVGVAMIISIAIIIVGVLFLRCKSERRRRSALRALPPNHECKYSTALQYAGCNKELYPMLASQERMASDPDRDYATTLQMRHMLHPPLHHHHHQYPAAEVWTCPYHGVTTASPVGTYDRRLQRHPSRLPHIYEMPRLEQEVEQGVVEYGGVVLPFYHQLDPRALQQLNAQRQLEAAAAAAVEGNGGIPTSNSSSCSGSQ